MESTAHLRNIRMSPRKLSMVAALLDAVAQPTEDDVRDALGGCLCRCTGYVKPVEAVLRAARER